MIKTTGTIENSGASYYINSPERAVNPKAIMQISRGAFDELSEYLTANGVIVCGTDGELHDMYEFMRKKYRRLPYIIYGNNSARSYIKAENHGNDMDGAILSGIRESGGFFENLKNRPNKNWAAEIPLSLPVLVIGNQAVFDLLEDAELNNLTMIQSETKEEILEFINNVYEGIIEMRTL